MLLFPRRGISLTTRVSTVEVDAIDLTGAEVAKHDGIPIIRPPHLGGSPSRCYREVRTYDLLSAAGSDFKPKRYL